MDLHGEMSGSTTSNVTMLFLQRVEFYNFLFMSFVKIAYSVIIHIRMILRGKRENFGSRSPTEQTQASHRVLSLSLLICKWGTDPVPPGLLLPVDNKLMLLRLLLLGSRPPSVSHNQSLSTSSVPLCPPSCLQLSLLQASLALAPTHTSSEPGQLHKIHRFSPAWTRVAF